MSETMRGKHKIFRSEAQWQEIIADYKRSGLTQDAFCQHASIPKSSFYKWHKRLGQVKSGETAPFIDLNTLMPSKTPTAWEITLDLGNGTRLSVRGG